jgi:hypothetical protein
MKHCIAEVLMIRVTVVPNANFNHSDSNAYEKLRIKTIRALDV